MIDPISKQINIRNFWFENVSQCPLNWMITIFTYFLRSVSIFILMPLLSFYCSKEHCVKSQHNCSCHLLPSTDRPSAPYKTYSCQFHACKQTELVPVPCNDCHKNFCMQWVLVPVHFSKPVFLFFIVLLFKQILFIYFKCFPLVCSPHYYYYYYFSLLSVKH